VLGQDPAKPDGSRRQRVGAVLQSSGFTDELTVREMVIHFASFYACPHHPDELIEMIGLSDKASAKTRSLSGGQQRRLDVAIGMVGRPELGPTPTARTKYAPTPRPLWSHSSPSRRAARCLTCRCSGRRSRTSTSRWSVRRRDWAPRRVALAHVGLALSSRAQCAAPRPRPNGRRTEEPVAQPPGVRLHHVVPGDRFPTRASGG
jgi:hypothetical protein